MMRGWTAREPSAASYSQQPFPGQAWACAVTPSHQRNYAMTQHVLFKSAALMVLVVLAAAIGTSPAYSQPSTGQITVLYDAFGKTSTMKKDWGFSALIEYGGKRILFDTGNNAEIFPPKFKAQGVDLRHLGFHN